MVGGWEITQRALQEETKECKRVEVTCKNNEQKADITPTLEPKKAVKKKVTSTRLTLKNTGSTAAENIVVSILDSQHFDVVGLDEKKVSIINPHDSETVECFIKVKFEPTPLDLPLERTVCVHVLFTIVFDDAQKKPLQNLPMGKVNF